jgi:hypothetical protein
LFWLRAGLTQPLPAAASGDGDGDGDGGGDGGDSIANLVLMVAGTRPMDPM